ncbi:MAG: segregation and condensation protein A, partial [Oscillospiraceae bacterium]
KIDSFEGPLDLLLHLISKNKMSIADIDISTIVRQYLDFLNKEDNLNLEIASEFIEMASRLLYLKSIILLPKKEEIENLKRELVGQLVEYQLCKEIADVLLSRSDGFKRIIRKDENVIINKDYENTHNKIDLLRAYYDLVSKNRKKIAPEKAEFANYVEKPYVSVTSKVLFILKSLRLKNKVSLYTIFNNKEKSANVATFLAVLELVKNNRIIVDDTCKYISLKVS